MNGESYNFPECPDLWLATVILEMTNVEKEIPCSLNGRSIPTDNSYIITYVVSQKKV